MRMHARYSLARTSVQSSPPKRRQQQQQPPPPPPPLPPPSTAGASTAGAPIAGAPIAGASTAGAPTAGASTAGAPTAGASTAGASRLRVTVPPRPGAYKMLEAGRGKKFWQGCRTAERPHDAFKRYGFHKAVFQIIGGLLQDNGVQMTPQLQSFVDNCSGTVRVSDCPDFPGQQGKYVLQDILQAVRDMKDVVAARRFIERNIIDAQDATGKLLYPSLAYVPSGNSSVSFPNLHGNIFFCDLQILLVSGTKTRLS